MFTRKNLIIIVFFSFSWPVFFRRCCLHAIFVNLKLVLLVVVIQKKTKVKKLFLQCYYSVVFNSQRVFISFFIVSPS